MMRLPFNRLNISTTKLVFGFLAIILLVMAVWIFNASSTFTAKAMQARDENIRLATTAQQMRVDVIQIQQWLTDISATRGLDGLDDGYAEAESSYRSFLGGLGVFEQYYRGREDKASMLSQVRALRDSIDRYYQTGRDMASAYIEQGPSGGNKMMAEFDITAEVLYEQLDPFINGQRSALGNAMDEIVFEASALKTATVMIFSIVFAVTFAGMYLQNRSNRRQIGAILKTVQQAAEGDLTVSMQANQGQLAEVSKAINELLGHFSGVISKVRENADVVKVSAQQISLGNSNLSRRLQEQASSLEETASSMEEMTSTVKQNADSASEANELANSTRDNAEKGGQVVQNAVTAMQAINDSSSKIADITTTIDSIAFQTNLLALNAAVEAARAGEQGRGFAVVAAEVRTLAQRSAEAAKEIKGLIEDSLEKIRIGSEQVDQSGQTLTGIVDGIKKVAALVSEINHANQEQSHGIDDVNKAVAHMDDRIQQNAAFVEESSAASDRMRDQVEALNELITYFRLHKTAAGSVETPQLEQHTQRLPGS